MIPFADRQIKRKDVYSDSVGILRQVGETLEIRPGPVRQLVVVAVGLAFVAGGVWLVLGGHGLQVVIGVASVALFGWALVRAIWRFARRRAIVLAPTGLRTTMGGEMPWEDIEDVTTVKYRHNTLVGVRLRSRERFVASFTEAERRSLARTNTVWRVFGGVFSPSVATDSNLTSVEGSLDFTRRHFGCDWKFGAMELDRSPREFAALLSEYAARRA